ATRRPCDDFPRGALPPRPRLPGLRRSPDGADPRRRLRSRPGGPHMTDPRHHRQRIIAEVGEAGQQRLERAAVAIVGVGGLGSPVALYLAAAGVGRLGLIDDQDVERSNLNRQVIFEECDVGRSKVEAAAGRLLLLDAGLRIDAHHENVRASNVAELFAQYDVVVDGTDAFETKFLLNDAAVLLRK